MITSGYSITTRSATRRTVFISCVTTTLVTAVALGGAFFAISTAFTRLQEGQLDGELVAVARSEADRRPELHVYTGQSAADLATKGLRGTFTRHVHRSGRALAEAQRSAQRQ